MDKRNIFIVALYEYKFSRRSILFGIFTLLSITGSIIYLFFPTDDNSVNGLFRFSMEWISQVLPSSMPYKTAYYFNFIQLLFVIGFVVSDARVARFKALEVLMVRPLSNGEIVIGNFLGKLLLFSLVNFLVFGVSILINVSFFPESFDLSFYLFYWVTLTLPTLVYFLGFSYFVTRFIHHQGAGMLILYVFLGILIYFGNGWLNGLFDPCARFIPSIFSDFTGHVNLENYLLQRGFILLAGMGFLALSVISYPRIPNDLLVLKKSLGLACGIFFVAGILAFIYHVPYAAVNDNREIYRQIYVEHENYPAARIVRNDLRVKELEDGGISVVSEMTLVNRAGVVIPLVVYLNPGLKIKTLEVDGRPVSFQREHQAVVIAEKLEPGDSCRLVIRYEGDIDSDLCFLDVDEGMYNSSGVNRIGIYDFGSRPAFCENGYKLLTPECVWYPVCVPPYGGAGVRDVNFSRYTLTVEHDPRLTAISQGKVLEEGEGKTSFVLDHDMPGISLCVGNYKRRAIMVGNVRMSVYYLPRHEYLLEEYDMIPVDSISKSLLFLKERMESEECVRTAAFVAKYSMAKFYGKERGVSDPIQQYPYGSFILAEVPVGFYAFPGVMQRTGEREQGGIVFLPEKAYSLKGYPTKVPDFVEDVDREGYITYRKLMDDMEMFIGDGSCNVRPMLRARTTFIACREYPILHDVLSDIAREYRNIGVIPSMAADYAAMAYLSNNSLKDALRDSLLSPGELKSIIRKKSDELHAYISMLVGKEQFRQFYHDFLASNLFKETTAEAFFCRFYQTFNVRLDSLVECWYNTDRLAALEIKDGRAIKITGESYRLYCFKVLNRGDVPGLVEADNNQCWVIPPGEGKEVRTRVPDISRKTIFYVKTPFAQNLPTMVELEPEEMSFSDVDTTTGVFSVDPSVFSPVGKNDEIIVDNEDTGFRVVKTENFITSLFQKVASRKKYYDYATGEDTWLPMIKEHFQGFPVRSAFCKWTGTGAQKVEWNVCLPQKGKYEVFFNYVKFAGRGTKNNLGDGIMRISDEERELKVRSSRYYTVFDGKKEHEVVAAPGKAELGTWVSLGVFDFSNKAKVTLSDRRTVQNGYLEEVVADAVKWVRVKE